MPRLIALPLAAITGVVLALAVPAQAANFEVSPVRVTLAHGEQSHLIAISNQGGDPLRFQLEAFSWRQRPNGDPLLAPTEDLIFFPRLFEVGPHEVQNVRVGAPSPATQSEKTYRLLLRQLKPVEAASAQAGSLPQAKITVLTNLDIPVFIEPAAPSTQAAISTLSLRNGQVAFTVGNTGNAHLRIISVRVRGLASGGQVIFAQQTGNAYVLAHSSRSYELPMPTADCNRVRSIEVAVESESGKLDDHLAITSADCTPNRAH